jgi:hypothetical protein
MGDNNNDAMKSRRWFLSLLSPTGKKAAAPGKVKMLTAEGKLVEIDKSVLDAASKKQKSSNKEIYDWMKNPSKENNP